MVNFTVFPTTITKSIYLLKKGDVVSTISGNFAFDRIPKGGKSWYGKSMNDGKNYRMRLIWGKEFNVIGKYDFVNTPKSLVKPMSNDIDNLNTGDLFVIKHGRAENAELFRYVRSTEKKIIGVNPITNKTFNIDKSFIFTKVTNLPY